MSHAPPQKNTPQDTPITLLQELYQVLQAAGGFTRLRDAARGIAVRRALQQVLQGFRQLGGALSGVLSQRDLVAVASLVLSGVCGRIAGMEERS